MYCSTFHSSYFHSEVSASQQIFSATALSGIAVARKDVGSGEGWQPKDMSLPNKSQLTNGKSPEHSSNSTSTSSTLRHNHQQPRKQRPRPRSISDTITISAERNSGGGYSFVKITIIVFSIVAIADVLFVWHSIQSSIGGEHYELHGAHEGAEVGLHHLHEQKRRKQVLEDYMETNAGSRRTRRVVGDDDQHKVTAKLLHSTTQQQSDGNSSFLPQHIELYKIQQKQKHDRVRIVAPNTRGAAIEQKNSNEHTIIDPRIAKILHSANVDIEEYSASQLPNWNDVVTLYGDKPILYGLETCETYRATIKPEDRMAGPAGLFNTGTNLLFELMENNCNIKEALHSKTHNEPAAQNGMRWSVPWGKHNPPTTHRLKHSTKTWGEGINQTAFFPIVTIKDPYTWMGSQCRHPYSVYWDHDTNNNNCPNLIDKKHPELGVPVMVRYALPSKYANGFEIYDSLIDLWNQWYEEYEAQSFPMLLTRFEDLLFHGEEVTRLACECVGGEFAKRFQYTEGSAKEDGSRIHGGANGLIKALIQYGDPAKRLEGMTDNDQRYSHRALNRELMEKYGYSYPPLQPGR